MPAACDGVGFVCRFSLALARGVGQRRRISLRLPPLDRVPEQARGVGQLVRLADGEDEQAFPAMRRADFRRRKQSCRKPVAQRDQSAGDFGEAEAEMMGDVFEEDEGRLDLADDAGDMRPEVARVVGAPSLARHAERLARVSRRDEIHRAAPRLAVECGNVVPDKSLIQGRVRHPRHESGRSVGLPLDMAHSSVPVLSISRCSGPLEPRYGMFTARVFWRRDRVLKSGTAQSRPTSRSRLSTKPVVCRSAMPNSTFIERHVWMAASL